MIKIASKFHVCPAWRAFYFLCWFWYRANRPILYLADFGQLPPSSIELLAGQFAPFILSCILGLRPIDFRHCIPHVWEPLAPRGWPPPRVGLLRNHAFLWLGHKRPIAVVATLLFSGNRPHFYCSLHLVLVLSPTRVPSLPNALFRAYPELATKFSRSTWEESTY